MSGTGSSSSSGGKRIIIGFTVKKRIITLPISATVGPQYCETVTEECTPCDGSGTGSGSATGSGTGSGSGIPTEPVSTPCGTMPSPLRVQSSTGLDFPIYWTAGQYEGYTGPDFTCDGTSLGVVLQINSGCVFVWSVVASWTGPEYTGLPVTPDSMSPFLISYNGPSDFICGGATITFTVSEY